MFRQDGVVVRRGWSLAAAAVALAIGCLLACPRGILAGGHPQEEQNVTDGPIPAETKEPIVLADGSVTETATDASLPGVTFGWSHTRNYSSSNTGGRYIQGERWVVDSFTCFLKQVAVTNNVELYLNHVSKRVFTRSGGTEPYTYTPPKDFHATLTHEAGTHLFTLKYTDTGETATFYDFDSSYWDAGRIGLLKERTDRYGTEKISYNYSTTCGGRIDAIMSSQGWEIAYTYLLEGTNTGNISQIEVKNGSGKVLQRVKYTYYVAGGGSQTYSPDVGSDGDLIMVQTFKLGTSDSPGNPYNPSDSDFSIKRTTMYRYFSSGVLAHKLKMVLSPASVSQALADGSTDQAHLLSLGDDTPVDGIGGSKPAFKAYTNVAYTYYACRARRNDGNF